MSKKCCVKSCKKGSCGGCLKSFPGNELELIRAQRKLAKKQVAALPLAEQKKLKSRKRDAEVSRVIMPVTPPSTRKRRLRYASPPPERVPCEFKEPTKPTPKKTAKNFLDYIQLTPRQIDVTANVDVHEIPQSPPEKVEIHETTLFNPEDVEIHEIPQSPPEKVEIQYVEFVPNVEIDETTLFNPEDVEIRNNVVPEADNEVTVAPSSSSNGACEKSFEDVFGEWIKQIDGDDLSDCDMDTEAEDSFIPAMTVRSAEAEPAVDADMTLYETRVLETEDRQNDQAIRKIAPQDCYKFEWTKDPQIFAGQREKFTGTPGPTFSLTKQTTAVDIFYKMIDTDFIDRICTETNRYANQKIKLLKDQKNISASSRLKRWIPTDRDEMITFLAIFILQGLYPLPEEESYFSFNGFGTMPYFRKTMPYNRFALLKQLIHFVDNETITQPDKLCKIQMVTDYFNDKFSHLYYPSQEIVIDESLLKWHGQLGFTQKISTKAAQVGVKTYELCESTSGYLWKFFIYAGKAKTGTVTATATANDDSDTDETAVDTDTTKLDITSSSNLRPDNATAKIVYDLVEPLLHRGHTLIMDNFYNSPLLARCLKRQQTDCFGTLRLNREFVPDSFKKITKTELKQGEVLASYCSDLSVIVWRDAKIVGMLSTYHSLAICPREKNDQLTYKPSVVLDYNKYMGGVDRKDQNLAAHPMERTRNKIWYKKVFRRIFNCAIFNCFVIFKSANPKISHRQFRITLAEDLLKIHRHVDLTKELRIINTRTGQKTNPTRPKLEHRHFPIKTGFRQCRCWLCAQRKITTRTAWKCLQCDVNLCIEGCFMEYHI